ncbi:uncharacterized protein M6B38_269210 [Iris pallida]|uniref:Uncharacterized protein n=1 Tax=Iris pallida TaxID=29817 RepID=A0AAX6I9R1_IRIPA|nr:uncharacterized protein M6B38_269210 [Iris pallida]
MEMLVCVKIGKKWIQNTCSATYTSFVDIPS